MKKIISLGLIWIGLLVWAPVSLPAAETAVSNVQVRISDDVTGRPAQYEISFITTQELNGGKDLIYVVFPDGYPINSQIRAGHISVNGQVTPGIDFTRRTLSILTPIGMNIAAGQTVRLNISDLAVTNPSQSGYYYLTVYTAKDQIRAQTDSFYISDYAASDTVSKASVTLQDAVGYRNQQWTVTFRTSAKGMLVGGSDYIYITFPYNVILPSNINSAAVTVNQRQADLVTVAGDRVYILLPWGLSVPAGGEVTAVFTAQAGIEANMALQDVTLNVWTSVDTYPVTSNSFYVPETGMIYQASRDPEVIPTPNTAGSVAGYTIRIQANTVDDITNTFMSGYVLTFPSGSQIPAAISPENVRVNGTVSKGVLTVPQKWEIILTCPDNIRPTSDVTITIDPAAGIVNPGPALHRMDIMALKGTQLVSSQSFEIRAGSGGSSSVVTSPTPMPTIPAVSPIPTPTPAPVSSRKVVQLTIGSKNALLNGTPLTLDAEPYLDGNLTMVPLRFVAEGLGAEVSYDSAKSTGTIKLGGKEITLWPKSVLAKVDGNFVTLEKAPQLVNGRLMVPLRFVSEYLGGTVVFVSIQAPITITLDTVGETVPAAVPAPTSAPAPSDPSAPSDPAAAPVPTPTPAPASAPTTTAPAASGSLIGKHISVKPEHSNVNLRRGPGTDYGKVGILLPGEIAEIIEAQNEWYHVRFVDYGMEAWVSAEYVNIS
ncbi:MAG: SH3 domain-containing protein [Peptococcaceae bacterium]|jgi:hypothetical protein|nr:SH3 domain-containing protein [Peptococcaceae bacterium]